MHKKIVIFIIVLSAFNLQCKKTPDSQPIIDTSKITETNDQGEKVGQVDETDWTEDTNWKSAEYNLFMKPNTTELENTETATITIHNAYPNPIWKMVVLNYVATEVTLVQVVVTDNMLNIKDRLFYKTKQGNNTIQIAMDADHYKSNTTYRIYYGFYSATNELYFKGHGDVKIQ